MMECAYRYVFQQFHIGHRFIATKLNEDRQFLPQLLQKGWNSQIFWKNKQKYSFDKRVDLQDTGQY